MSSLKFFLRIPFNLSNFEIIRESLRSLSKMFQYTFSIHFQYYYGFLVRRDIIIIMYF